MGEQLDTPSFAAARIAARQHGVVTFAQLRAAKVPGNAITRWVSEGRLHRIHRGVYAVGHRGLSREGRWMGAVLACREGAVLSHMAAAALWGLLRPTAGPIDVSVPTYAGGARRHGIRLHRCASLVVDPGEPSTVTRRDRIPVTTVARTVLDLRRSAPARLVRRAIRQAELAGLPLGPDVVSDGSRSDLEGDFLEFCRRHGLPRPRVNVRIGRWTVDFLWPELRLVVETDFYGYHRGSVAFEDDHTRDLDLRAAGFEVRRFTAQQLNCEPERVAADLRIALSDSETRIFGIEETNSSQ